MKKAFYSFFPKRSISNILFTVLLSLTVFLTPIFSVSASTKDTGSMLPIEDANIKLGNEYANYGSTVYAFVGLDSSNGYPMRHLIKFDSTAMSDIVDINQVHLNLYAYYTGFYEPITLKIHFVNSTWSESTVTWNNQPTYEEAVNTTIFIDDPDEYKLVDITKMVLAWTTGEKPNHGLILEADDHGTINQYARIWTREKEVNQTKITYINNVVPEINQGVILPFTIGILVMCITIQRVKTNLKK